MATTQQLQIHCATCGYWMPSPAPASDEPMADAAALKGSVVQCPKCLQKTTCTAANMRLKDATGALTTFA